jgi:hypothetical protein
MVITGKTPSQLDAATVEALKLKLGITEWSDPPTDSTSTGTTGNYAYDINYLYICVTTNTWKRVLLETWIAESPTPTVTPTLSESPTPTITPEASPDISPTPTITPEASPDVSPTPTPTITPTFYMYTLGYDISDAPTACSGYTSSPIAIYAPISGGTSPSVDETIYSDSNLTTPASDGLYSDGSSYWTVSGGAGLITEVDVCS